MAFVNKQGVHAQVAEVHGAIFFSRAGKQLRIPGFHFFPLLFQLLDRGPPAVVFLSGLYGFNHRVNLLLKNFLLDVAGHVDFFETGMGDNDGIPFACGDAAEKPLPVLFGEVRLVRNQNIRTRVKPVELVPPLVQQVVRHHNHRLFDKTHAF